MGGPIINLSYLRATHVTLMASININLVYKKYILFFFIYMVFLYTCVIVVNCTQLPAMFYVLLAVDPRCAPGITHRPCS